jgi:hypothetical protein
MRRVFVLALRFGAVVALVAAAAAVLPLSTRTSAPYGSPLRDLSLSTAAHAAACDNRICSSGPRLRFKCASNPGTNCTLLRGGQDCEATTVGQ